MLMTGRPRVRCNSSPVQPPEARLVWRVNTWWTRQYRRSSFRFGLPVQVTLPAWYPADATGNRQAFFSSDGHLRGSVSEEIDGVARLVPSDRILATISDCCRSYYKLDPIKPDDDQVKV